MNYTTNFNLNKPEGTDLYNHLTVDNPNMDTIDAAMQANKLASVGAATELVSGTVHAITRADSDQNIFKFKATGDFKAGDTITVDGVSVNAYTTGGQQLLNDAYVLSAEVICVLDGTSLWVLVNKTPEASEVEYDSVYNVKSKITAVENTITPINSGTPTSANANVRVYRGLYQIINNMVIFHVVIGVLNALYPNEAICNNLPTSPDANANVGYVTPVHNAADQTVKTARVNGDTLYTNTNNFVPGTYWITGAYMLV